MSVKMVTVFVINDYNLTCRTPLHAAAYSEQGESIQILLSHKADVNMADYAGKTAIMYAAINGNASSVGEYT